MLELNNVSIGYGNKTVVNNISFTVHTGETVSIVGESGSGKSTILKAVLGLLGENGHVVGGLIRYNDMDLEHLNKNQRRALAGKTIAMIFQHAGRSMDPVVKIGKQFHEVLLTKEKISYEEAKQRAVSCMHKLMLKNPEQILESYPSMLSGGTNQRVAIALAMVLEPKLILADEPTSALDMTSQVSVVRTLQKLQDESMAAILMVTHNMGVVAQIADKVGVMYQGQMVEWGSCEDVLHHPFHPYTKMLLDSVLQMDGSFVKTKSKYQVAKGDGCSFFTHCPIAQEICGKEFPSDKHGSSTHWCLCHCCKNEGNYE